MVMRIFPLGEEAITVEFGRELSVESNELALELAEMIQRQPFPGFIECVPAYVSTTVFFDSLAVRRAFPKSESSFETVSHIIDTLAKQIGSSKRARPQRIIEVSVSFAPADAPDLRELAAEKAISVDDFVSIFLSGTYRVYMLGFLPGFAYMGSVDERIASPRLQTPRLRVPKGSVGIAGRQTGIYPLESPGGWRLIGRTDKELFDPAGDPLCCFAPGDQVRFLSK